ncbi:MAG: tRNA pseudouridine(55) synthase TruB [Patescibacteria group bacterium]
MKRKKNKPEGFFGIKKEKGPTSHDIIDELRDITGVEKIGHAGTLDPSAMGVLVVAIGREYTKKISKYRKAEKEYRAIIEFGKVSDTDDLEGKIKTKKVKRKPTKEEIEEGVSDFIGCITQYPPVYSAVKIKGKRSYKLAREGKNPTPPPRKVIVKNISIIQYKYPKLELDITTGSGVYIRSIARDLGEKLEVGALLANLVRTKVGEFKLEDCYSINEFKNKKPYLKE